MSGRARVNWVEYALEGWALGLFMVSACGFGVLLFHPSSPVVQRIPDELGAERVIGRLALDRAEARGQRSKQVRCTRPGIGARAASQHCGARSIIGELRPYRLAARCSREDTPIAAQRLHDRNTTPVRVQGPRDHDRRLAR